jgi:hypothetical protein
MIVIHSNLARPLASRRKEGTEIALAMEIKKSTHEKLTKPIDRPGSTYNSSDDDG